MPPACFKWLFKYFFKLDSKILICFHGNPAIACYVLQFNHTFWVTNGTVRLKALESSRVHGITRLNDLKDLKLITQQRGLALIFLLIFSWLVYAKACSLSKQLSFSFISFTFIQIAVKSSITSAMVIVYLFVCSFVFLLT